VAVVVVVGVIESKCFSEFVFDPIMRWPQSQMQEKGLVVSALLCQQQPLSTFALTSCVRLDDRITASRMEESRRLLMETTRPWA
jgi:hypothetical protein